MPGTRTPPCIREAVRTVSAFGCAFKASANEKILVNAGVVLCGPDPATLVDPIPFELLRDEMRRSHVDWGKQILADPAEFENRFYQGYITLTFCRVWCDVTLGNVGSKRRGSAWAKERLDPSWHDLIDRAWDTRPVPEVSVRTPPDPEDWKRTLDLVRLIVDRLRPTA